MMSLTVRKIIVLGLIGTVLLIGNMLFMANWLSEKGVVDWAQNTKSVRYIFRAQTGPWFLQEKPM